MKNLKQIQFTDQDFQTNLQMIQDLVGALTFQAALTTKEKQRLLKVGDAQRAFTNRAMLYGKQYPDLIPNIVDVSALGNVLDLLEKVEAYIRYIRPLLNSMEDVKASILSGAYKETLVIYHAFKALQGLKVEGVKDAFNDLRVLFNRTKKSREKEFEKLDNQENREAGDSSLVT